MECFIADFSQFFGKNINIWLSSGQLGTRHKIQALDGFFWSFLITLNPKFYVAQQLEHSLTFW